MRRKTIRQMIVLVELLVLVAAVMVWREKAPASKHYQLVYHRFENGRVDLLDLDTGKAVRLVEMPYRPKISCEIELMIRRTVVTEAGSDTVWLLNYQTTQDDALNYFFMDGLLTKLAHEYAAPVLLDFWSAGDVTVIRAAGTHLIGHEFSIRVDESCSYDSGSTDGG